jgi:hypothetical protein
MAKANTLILLNVSSHAKMAPDSRSPKRENGLLKSSPAISPITPCQPMALQQFLNCLAFDSIRNDGTSNRIKRPLVAIMECANRMHHVTV